MFEQGKFRLSIHTDCFPEKIATMWWLARIMDSTLTVLPGWRSTEKPRSSVSKHSDAFLTSLATKTWASRLLQTGSVCFPSSKEQPGNGQCWLSFPVKPMPRTGPLASPYTRQAHLQCQHRAASARAQAELQEQKLDILLTESIFGNRRAINIRILNHLEHLPAGEPGTSLWQSQGWCGAGIAALAQPCHRHQPSLLLPQPHQLTSTRQLLVKQQRGKYFFFYNTSRAE